MNYRAIQGVIHRPYKTVIKVVDGDGLVVQDLFTKEVEEIRLYGIDAPELKRCKKLIQDEKETHIAGELLIKLGWQSFQFLNAKVPVGTNCTLLQEPGIQTDYFGRTLAYVILPDGKCLNEEMIREGYSKPYDKIFCTSLPWFQELNLQAKTQRKGLYSQVTWF